MNTVCDLKNGKCKPCEGGIPPLDDEAADNMLGQLKGWQRSGNAIHKSYEFADYHAVIAFVNATAWVSHREDHHPDIEAAYNRVAVSYTTHAINGLSENDFICAAKIDALFEL